MDSQSVSGLAGIKPLPRPAALAFWHFGTTVVFHRQQAGYAGRDDRRVPRERVGGKPRHPADRLASRRRPPRQTYSATDSPAAARTAARAASLSSAHRSHNRSSRRSRCCAFCSASPVRSSQVAPLSAVTVFEHWPTEPKVAGSSPARRGFRIVDNTLRESNLHLRLDATVMRSVHASAASAPRRPAAATQKAAPEQPTRARAAAGCGDR